MASIPPRRPTRRGTPAPARRRRRGESAGRGDHLLERLTRTIGLISTSLDLTDTLQAALDAVRETFAVEVAVIHVLHEAEPALILAGTSGLTDAEAAEVPRRIFLDGEGILARVARTRTPSVHGPPGAAAPVAPLPAWARGLASLLCVPLVVRERVFGTLLAGGRRPATFGPDDVALAGAIAQVLAPALERAALYGEVERLYAGALKAKARADAVAEIGRALATALDVDRVLALIVEKTRTATRSEACGIFRWDPGRQAVVPVAMCGLSDGFAREFALSQDEGFARIALGEGRPVWTADAQADPHAVLGPALRGLLQAEGIRGLLAVPITLKGEIFGTLVTYRRDAHAFADEEVRFQATLADQAAVALETARLFQAEQDRRRQVEAVRAVAGEVLRELDLTALLGLITRRAVELARATGGVVYLWDEEEGVLVPEAWHGLGEWVRELRPRRGEGLAGIACRDSRGMIVNDYRTWPHAGPLFLERTGVTAALAEPLLYRDRVLGAITLTNEGAGRTFAEADRETLALFAAQAAIAIENARLYAEARQALANLRAAQEQWVQAEKLRALGEMAGGVAHDFNNLLTAILGQAQFLRLRHADPALREGLAAIERAALDGAETVRRILGFAGVRSEASFAPVRLGPLLAQALDVTRPRWRDEAQQRGAPIETETDLAPVPPILGNAAELREVLVNLIFNAVDAMPCGGRLTVGARPAPAPSGPGNQGGQTPGPAGTQHGSVEFFVRDTGAGMPEEVRRRAFDPFFTTKGVHGTGLGLAMVYGIVTRHGGEVRLESREGAGTTVWIRVPTTADAPPAAEAPAPPAASRPGRIVVVDDEEVLAGLLADILRLQHHQVVTFTNPRRALEHLGCSEADLLFTDLGMPEMSGWEMAREARALRPALPVVLVTGWGSQLDPGRIQAGGVAAVVAKPFRLEDILEVLGRVFPAPPGAPPSLPPANAGKH